MDTDGVWDDKLPSLKTTRDKIRFRIFHIPSWKSLFQHHTSRYSDPNDSIASNVLYVNKQWLSELFFVFVFLWTSFFISCDSIEFGLVFTSSNLTPADMWVNIVAIDLPVRWCMVVMLAVSVWWTQWSKRDCKVEIKKWITTKSAKMITSF